MFEKTCPKCGKKSYSSSDRGTWICPNTIVKEVKEKESLLLYSRCGTNLSSVQAQIAR